MRQYLSAARVEGMAEDELGGNEEKEDERKPFVDNDTIRKIVNRIAVPAHPSE